MDVKSKVFRRKTGKAAGKWVARIEYLDPNRGKKRFMERERDRFTEASDERDRLIEDVKRSHGQIQTGERMTFRQLTNYCLENLYQPAVIVEGRKIEGVRSHETARNHMTVLTDYFGDTRIGEITTESLFAYRRWRLKNGSRHPAHQDGPKVPVKLATINRELSAMRRVMRHAYGKGWITKDIFFKAGVIEESAELERKRLLTEAEEERLLDSCGGSREIVYERTRFGKEEKITAHHDLDNPHLKALILLALDAGLRRGEILKLRWDDIHFEADVITILATNTKTQRERLVPLTQRTADELVRIKAFSDSERPFQFANFKRSWRTAKRLAGIEDLRFHDLRRTAITRWIQRGLPIAIAGKIAGHSRLETTMKHYAATDTEMVRDLAADLNRAHASASISVSSEAIN